MLIKITERWAPTQWGVQKTPSHSWGKHQINVVHMYKCVRVYVCVCVRVATKSEQINFGSKLWYKSG